MTLALLVMPLLMKPIVCTRAQGNQNKRKTAAKKKTAPVPDESNNETHIPSWTATGQEACDSFLKHIEVCLYLKSLIFLYRKSLC